MLEVCLRYALSTLLRDTIKHQIFDRLNLQ